jgi:hypothetical protein
LLQERLWAPAFCFLLFVWDIDFAHSHRLANAPQAITIWLNVEGLPRTSRCVLIAGQKGVAAVFHRLFFVPNPFLSSQHRAPGDCALARHGQRGHDCAVVRRRLCLLQAVRGQLGFVSRLLTLIFFSSVGLQDVFAHNPRLLVHPVAVAIKTTAVSCVTCETRRPFTLLSRSQHNTYRLGHGFDPAAPEFSSVADLIAHYQNHGIRIRSFQVGGGGGNFLTVFLITSPPPPPPPARRRECVCAAGDRGRQLEFGAARVLAGRGALCARGLEDPAGHEPLRGR